MNVRRNKLDELKSKRRKEFIPFFFGANIITCRKPNMNEGVNSSQSKRESHELATVGGGSDNDSVSSFHDSNANVRFEGAPGNVSDGELRYNSKSVSGGFVGGESRDGSDD